MTFLWAWLAVSAYAAMGYLVWLAFRPVERGEWQPYPDWFWSGSVHGHYEQFEATPSELTDQQGSEPTS